MIHAVGVDILRRDIVHPCTRTLACAREVVGIEEAYETSVGFGHLEYLHFRIIYRHVVHLLKLDAIQFGSQIKGTLAYVVQFEVGLQFLLVQVVLLGTQFLGVVPPVPGLQLLARQVLLQHLLQFGSLALSSLQRGRPYRCQELIHGLRVLSHAVGQDIVGGAVVAKQFGFLDTQRHGALDHFFVVIGVVVVATGGVSHEQLLAQLAILAVLEHRGETGALGREEPLALMTGCLCLFGCGGFGALGQTLQLGLVLHKVLISVGLGYHVVAELQA